MNRRALLVSAAALGSAALCRPWLGLPAPADPDSAAFGDEPLRDLAAERGLLFGAAVRAKQLAGDAPFADVVARQCNIIAPELELKWDFLRPDPDSYDFSGGDALYAFAQAHGMQFRGHTLVWEAALPPWFEQTVNAGNAERILREHISKVVGHYAGKMHSWDVVNEGLQLEDGRADGLKNTPWLRFLGPDYIEMAFRAAHEADPGTMLVYNENWLEPEDDAADKKRAAALAMLAGLKARGVPVHALGIQSHIFGEAYATGPNFRRFLEEVSGLGLALLITEMDVRDKNLPRNAELRDRMVTTQYYRYLSFMLQFKSLKTVLTWGLSDRYTWIAHSHPRPDGLPVRPLPYDADMQPAPAWSALQRAFDEASVR